MKRAPRVFGFGLALCAIALGAMMIAARSYHQDREWVDHTDEVRLEVSELFSNLRSAEMSHRGFLVDGVADPIDPYHHAVQASRAGIQNLRLLLVDNAAQQHRLALIADVAEREIQRMDLAHSRMQAGDWGMAKATLDDGKRNVDALRLLLGNMSLTEKLLLQERSEHAALSAQLLLIAAGASALLALVTIGWAWHRLSNIALDLSQSEASHRQTSLYDELTGAYNRRGLNQVAKDLLARHSVITVIYGDLDGLKPINDRLGHEMGDRAIKEVATILQSCVRQGDVVARLGGDEMVCALGGDCAGPVIARIEHALAVSNQRFGRAYSLRISMGSAVSRPDDTLDSLLARADAVMYEAKQARKKLAA